MDPQTNHAISKVDNAKTREEFPGFLGPGSNVQSGEYKKLVPRIFFTIPHSLLYHGTARVTWVAIRMF